MRLPSFVVLLCLAWGAATYAVPPTLVRVYDQLASVGGDTLRGANVVAELINPDSTKIAYDSVSGFSLGKNPYPFDTTADSKGYYALRLIPNKFIIPHGSRYNVSVSYNGRRLYLVRLNVTQSDSVRTRDAQE